MRVHNFAISLDGYAAGPFQSVEHPPSAWADGGCGPSQNVRQSHVDAHGGRHTFVAEGIEAALERARNAAEGKDVRIGGGVATIEQYLRAGLVDDLHMVIVPIMSAVVNASSTTSAAGRWAAFAWR